MYYSSVRLSFLVFAVPVLLTFVLLVCDVAMTHTVIGFKYDSKFQSDELAGTGSLYAGCSTVII